MVNNKRLINAYFLSLPIMLVSTIAWASSQVGTLTQLQGEVKIFSNPSKTLPPEGSNEGQKVSRALFEGEYYTVRDAKMGEKVENGNIVKTSPGAKTRVIFENGDQITVGSGTAYRIKWDQDSPKGETHVSLMYGKLRGVIEKGGPRSHLKIKTRTAVMGVRGTDFFIAEGGNGGATAVSIIRGSVEVTPIAAPKNDKNEKGHPGSEAGAPQAKPIHVSAGFSAEVGPQNPQEKLSPAVELRKTTQEELSGIQKSSAIASPVSTPTTARSIASDDVQRNIAALEKKATETTLNDIKTYDKALYAAIEKQPGRAVSIDAVNQTAIQTLIKEAPKAPAKHKPYQSELDDLENGAYERYFKVID
jgi:hypothetical protein